MLGTVLLALGLLAAAPAAQALPDEFRASYLASARGISLGRAEMELRRDDNGDYRYTSELRARGALALLYRHRVNEVSTGRISADGVLPDDYRYQRGDRDDRIEFDYEQGEVTLRYKGGVDQERFEPGAVDPLATHLAIMHDLANGAEQMRYVLVQPRRIRVYQLEVTDRERIRTPEGRYDTLRVDVVGQLRIREGDDVDLESADIPPLDAGDEISFWLAPELNYLPVRIRYVDESDGAVEMNLERIRRLRPAPND